MKIIGLCGGSGSGKNEVCAEFAALGINSVDTDIVARRVVRAGSPCLAELTGAFGSCILLDNGELDRRILSEIIFASAEKRGILNGITHKYILRECGKIIEANSSAGFFIINAPLLFESGYNKRCDIIIAVLADFDMRVKRITARDHIDEAIAKRRIYSQMGDEFLLLNSDYHIFNNGALENLRSQVSHIYQKINRQL